MKGNLGVSNIFETLVSALIQQDDERNAKADHRSEEFHEKERGRCIIL